MCNYVAIWSGIILESSSEGKLDKKDPSFASHEHDFFKQLTLSNEFKLSCQRSRESKMPCGGSGGHALL